MFTLSVMLTFCDCRILHQYAFKSGKPIKFQCYTFVSEDDQVTDTPRTNIVNLSPFKVVKGKCSCYLVDSAYVC